MERKQLEQAINNSPFFCISGENMEAARATAKNKLASDLLKYSEYYWKGDEYIDEISDKIIYCMENYNPEIAIFTNYFKNQVRYAIQDRDKKERKQIRMEGIDPVKRKRKDGSEFSIFEKKQSTYKNIEDVMDTLYENIICFEIIEQAFLEKQERIRPRLRTILTHKFYDILISMPIPDKHYTWIDYNFLEKYTDVSEIFPTQRELAAMLGRCEQVLSRDITLFCDLVKLRLDSLKK